MSLHHLLKLEQNRALILSSLIPPQNNIRLPRNHLLHIDKQNSLLPQNNFLTHPTQMAQGTTNLHSLINLHPFLQAQYCPPALTIDRLAFYPLRLCLN